MDFFTDLAMQPPLTSGVSAAYEAQHAADDARMRTMSVEGRLNRLTLVCAALWELLQEKTGVTAEELAARVREIDLRDGRLDGKIASAARTCPKCNRAVSATQARCMYCGAELPATDLFGEGKK